MSSLTIIMGEDGTKEGGWGEEGEGDKNAEE